MYWGGKHLIATLKHFIESQFEIKNIVFLCDYEEFLICNFHKKITNNF